MYRLAHRLRPLRGATAVALVLALLALGATVGAVFAANGNAYGHNGHATLRLTPAAARADLDSTRRCGDRPCLKVSVTANYVYTPDAGNRRCPEYVRLSWDGATAASTSTEDGDSACTAVLRRVVIGSTLVSNALASGTHTVCATTWGGPPVSSSESCTNFTVLPQVAVTPKPSSSPKPQLPASPAPTATSAGQAPAPPAPTPASNGQLPEPAPIATVEASPAPAIPALSAVPGTQQPAIPAPPTVEPTTEPAVPAVPTAAATAAVAPFQPAPETPAAAAPTAAASPVSNTGGSDGGPLFALMLALAIGVGAVDVVYVIAVNRGGVRR